jgi:elongation factor G
VISDLKGRLAEVQRTDRRDNAQVIHALVPLANMSGYASTLHAMTQGPANFFMRYDR